jgi:hypothetical protein
MMGDWADAIADTLDEAEDALAEALNLNRGMSGEDFERTLGELFSAFRSVTLVKKYIYIGREGPKGVRGGIREWIRFAEQREPKVIAAINRSLWSEFGLARVDVEAAMNTYRELSRALDALPAEKSTRLFSVTTNYDRSGEEAWAGVGFDVDDGGRQRLQGGSKYLDLRTVRPWSVPATVPHLHLHGAVGWYRTSQGIRIDPADRDFDDREVPAVLYPDPNKDPYNEGDASVVALWEKFGEALQDATHIIVVGHSLHDKPLVDALAATAKRPGVRLAVTFYGSSPADAEAVAGQLSVAGLGHSEDVSLIPIDFHAEGDFSLVGRWIEGSVVQADGTAIGTPP